MNRKIAGFPGSWVSSALSPGPQPSFFGPQPSFLGPQAPIFKKIKLNKSFKSL